MSNWQLTITLAALVFAIFGANWLNQRQTERLFDSLRAELKAEIIAARAELKTEIGLVKAELKTEIGLVKAEVSALTQKVDRIERQLESLFKPILPRS